MNLKRKLLAASWRSWNSADLRIIGPRWLQLVWTFIVSCVIGLGFFVRPKGGPRELPVARAYVPLFKAM